MNPTDEMLASILGDPESMQQIKELAQMLSAQPGSEENPDNISAPGDTAATDNTASPAGGAPDFSGLAGLFGTGGIDFNTLMNISKVLSAAGGDNKNTALLLALRPLLTAERQQRVDKAVKMLKIYALVIALKDSGMLGQIF